MSERANLPLVVCSMDNTLLANHGRILGCDDQTIRLYCAMGGRFSVLTRRTPQGMRNAFPEYRRLSASICCGGSVILSPSEEAVQYAARLEEAPARAAVRDALREFPEISVQILHPGGRLYAPRCNRYLHAHLREEAISCIMTELEDVPTPWVQVSFYGNAMAIGRLDKYLNERGYLGCSLHSPNAVCLELSQEGVAPEDAFLQLCAIEKVQPQDVIFIAGGYDDLSVMAQAGQTVTVADAPVEVRLTADRVLCAARDGGVGEYLYELLK